MKPKHTKSQFFLNKKLFTDLTSFSELENRISNLPEMERGYAFDVFAEAYFATQSIYQVKDIWPDSALPQDIRRALGLPPMDMGIDGVFKTHGGEYHAYQVKYRTNRPSLSWTELSTFMGLSDKSDKRVLITNSIDLSFVMDNRSDFYSVKGNVLDILDKSDFQTIDIWLKSGIIERARKSPKPHQIHALNDILHEFNINNRATAVMACGTGKTLVALWVAEKSEAKKILVLLPSLALIRQTLRDWSKENSLDTFNYICICSDTTVNKDIDEWALKQPDLNFPVTTGKEDIEKFLQNQNISCKIIFSTYQSCQVLAQAMPQEFFFDLAIFDEAHKTASRKATYYAFALQDKNVPIKKRLFLTATPRHYDVYKKDKEGDQRIVYSMDDQEIYGRIAHKLSFKKAADDGLICDYKIIISIITSEMVNRELLKQGEVVIGGDIIRAQRIANILAIQKAIAEYGIKRIFSFHNSVSSAQSFTSNANEGICGYLNDFTTLHINGSMSSRKRETLFKEFAEATKAIMSNARCLTEGVDVPAVDMVAFICPKKSRIDIVQAAGRAMRKTQGKDRGYILIPLFVQVAEGETIEKALEKTDFDTIWGVLQAIQDQDESLVEIISQLREEKGRKILGCIDNKLREKIEIIGPELCLDVLREAITTKIVDRFGQIWDERFGELVHFKQKHGHCNVPQNYSDNPTLAMWVGTQRHLYNIKSSRLTLLHITKLNEIDFDWSPIATQWEKMFRKLDNYREKNGHCNIAQRDLKDTTLATWVAEQRKDYKKGNLKVDQIVKLKSLGFVFDVLNTRWDQLYLALCLFKKEYGHCNVPTNPKNLQLSTWVQEQRKAYRKDKISLDRIDKLNEIGFCWNLLEHYQEQMLQELHEYKKKYGHCNVPQQYEASTLGKWLIAQRISYNKGKLSSEIVEKLNNIGIDWNPLETVWERMYQALCEFKNEYGHCIVPQNYSKNPTLGNWVSVQRTLYSTNRLSQGRLLKLNSIGFVWNKFDAQWEEMFGRLSEFRKIAGHCNLPHDCNDRSLIRWVGTQCYEYKKGNLAQKRIDALNSIGFDWR